MVHGWNLRHCSNVFQQHYVIRIPLDQSAVTCACALLPGKSPSIFIEQFLNSIIVKVWVSMLIQLILNWQP